MKVAEIMSKQPQVLSQDASLCEAAEKMSNADCGMLPIGEVDDIIGVLTDRDIVARAVAKHKDLESTHVSEVMSEQPIFCHENDEIFDAVAEMNRNNVRRMLVKNNEERLVGVLSLADVIRRVDDKSELAEVFERTKVA